MFKKKCVAVAVGLALIQFSPAWAEICTDCTLINESLSLTEKDIDQKKDLNYDKNVQYNNNIVLSNGGKKELNINLSKYNDEGEKVLLDFHLHNSSIELNDNSSIVHFGSNLIVSDLKGTPELLNPFKLNSVFNFKKNSQKNPEQQHIEIDGNLIIKNVTATIFNTKDDSVNLDF